MSCQSRDVRDLLERLEGRLSRAVLRGSNVHSATRLLYKWGRKCTYCGKENIPLQAEHIVPRVKGGSNRISNLCLACEKCNLAKGTKSIEEFRRSKPDLLKCILAQAKAPLKDAAAVNTTRWELNIWLETLGLPIECGSGGLTKYNRTTRELPKTHWLDAACVGKSTPETLQITGVRPLQICANGHGYRQRRGSPMPKLKTKDSPFLPEALGQGSPGSV